MHIYEVASRFRVEDREGKLRGFSSNGPSIPRPIAAAQCGELRNTTGNDELDQILSSNGHGGSDSDSSSDDDLNGTVAYRSCPRRVFQ